MGFLGFMDNNAFGTGLNGWQFAGLAASHWANPQGTAPLVAGINQNRFKAADVQMRLASIEEARQRTTEYMANAALDRAMRAQALQFDKAQFDYKKGRDAQSDINAATEAGAKAKADRLRLAGDVIGRIGRSTPALDSYIENGGSFPDMSGVAPAPWSTGASTTGLNWNRYAGLGRWGFEQLGDAGSYGAVQEGMGGLLGTTGRGSRLNLTGQPQGLTFGMEKPTPADAIQSTATLPPTLSEQDKAVIYAATNGAIYNMFTGALNRPPVSPAPVTQQTPPPAPKNPVSQTTTRQTTVTQPGALPPVGGIKGPSPLPTPQPGSSVGKGAATQRSTEAGIPEKEADSVVAKATIEPRITKATADAENAQNQVVISGAKAAVAKQLESLNIQIKTLEKQLKESERGRDSLKTQELRERVRKARAEASIAEKKLADPLWGKNPPKAEKPKSLLEQTATPVQLKKFRKVGMAEDVDAATAERSYQFWSSGREPIIGMDGNLIRNSGEAYSRFIADQKGLKMKVAVEELVAKLEELKAKGTKVKWEAVKALPGFKGRYSKPELDQLYEVWKRYR